MTKMIEVTQQDANNYCRVLTALGMEEEGDPVAEVERLRALVEGEHPMNTELRRHMLVLCEENDRLRLHLRLAVNHISALTCALDDLASLGATVAICGTEYDDATARKLLDA